MTALPFASSSNPLKEILNGSYGTFYTEDSYQMYYLMGAVPIKRIGLLETASQAFDIKNVSFDEMIQRDVDAVRVRDIANKYLEHSSGKAVFFPPLLVSLIGYENGSIVDGYAEVEENVVEGWYEKTWDKTKFQIRLPLSHDEQDFSIEYEGKKHSIYNYGCQLKFNPDSMKLVVLDGQHRLSALKHLSQDSAKSKYVENISIPICVVISPEAKFDGVQKVTSNLRELFVTINSKGKEVSGHFITLLKDRSLSAIAVRELAEVWKVDDSNGFSLLHLLEWNQREKSKSNQVNSPYSITTISILADVLSSYLFKAKTFNFLNLSTATELSELSDCVSPSKITEDSFSPEQEDILRDRIKEYIIPSLNILFTMPSPYQSVISAFSEVTSWLDRQVSDKMSGSVSFRDDVLKNFRKTNKLDLSATVEFESNFELQFEKQMANQNEYFPFFLNVFHQGLVRSWIELSEKLMMHGIAPNKTAEAMIKACEKIVFNIHKEVFSPTRTYNQYILYKGEAVIVTKRAKDQWVNLILATLNNKEVSKIFVHELAVEGDLKESVENEVQQLAKNALDDFLKAYRNAVWNDIEKHWRDRGFDELTVTRLTNAYVESQSNPDSEEFENIIHELVSGFEKKSKVALNGILEL